MLQKRGDIAELVSRPYKGRQLVDGRKYQTIHKIIKALRHLILIIQLYNGCDML